jgi:hypothetical protein
MNGTTNATLCAAVAALTLLPVQRCLGADQEKNVTKNVTIITGQSSADGASEVREELLEECIVSLPATADLQADVVTQSQYLKEINGDPAKNEFVKTYTATIEINYMVRQKALIIVTSKTVQAQAPVMRDVDKSIRHSVKFESNPANGDLSAGHSNRQYYFSTAEGAIADAKKRAVTWLAQQSAVLCSRK